MHNSTSQPVLSLSGTMREREKSPIIIAAEKMMKYHTYTYTALFTLIC